MGVLAGKEGQCARSSQSYMCISVHCLWSIAEYDGFILIVNSSRWTNENIKDDVSLFKELKLPQHPLTEVNGRIQESLRKLCQN